jgi:hypothetical protein
VVVHLQLHTLATHQLQVASGGLSARVEGPQSRLEYLDGRGNVTRAVVSSCTPVGCRVSTPTSFPHVGTCLLQGTRTHGVLLLSYKDEVMSQVLCMK